VESEVLRAIVLPGERTMVVRRMRPGDVDAIAALYEHLSVDDRYRRFFSATRPTRRGTQRWVDRCTSDGTGVVAVIRDEALASEELVAEAGFVPLADGDAEFAITVAAEWRGWLGPVLLDLLAELAAERGIPNLEAEILVDNRPMLGMAHHRGEASLGSSDFSALRVIISTTGTTPGWPPRGDAPRLLVEAAGYRWSRTSALDASGYEVVTCGGPAHRGTAGCPALEGRRCPLVDGADAVVVALRPDDPRTEELIAAHRRLRPELRIVVQPPTDLAIDVPPDPGVCRLAAGAPAAELLAAIRDAVQAASGGPDDGENPA
jgi:RimJ/RimL family protein N-acetyltransferase